jgi:ABC-type dipeptide/oligopeptide/nickel transport system permease component
MRALLLRYALLLAVVVALNFLLPRLLPGDPLDAIGNDSATSVPALTQTTRLQLRAAYHLDEPVTAQFAAYVADLARGDLGWSISRGAPVSQLVADRLLWTLGLVGSAVLLASVSGVLLGIVAAWRGGRLDALITVLATMLAALPEFLVGIGLLLVLAVGLRWLPLYGGRASFAPAMNGTAALLDLGWHLALPVLTLVLSGVASFTLLTRGAIRPVLTDPYLATARGKGLPELRVALGHALPNAVPPIAALLGVRLGHVLGGALVVERVFAIPGLGLLAFDAIQARDYPVLQAVFLLGSLGMLVSNLVVDIGRVRQHRPTTTVGGPEPNSGPRALVVVGFAIIVLAVGLAVQAPALAPYDPRLSSGLPFLPASGAHLMGTNDVGQDVFSELLWGARASLSVAAVVGVLATALAWSVGLAAGLNRRAEPLLMAIADALLVLPPLPLFMLAVTLVGPSHVALTLVLAAFGWPAFARIVRAQTDGIRDASFVEAARSLGATPMRIAWVHVLPATLSLLPATLALTLRYALFGEATLAFLGLGDPVVQSWGSMLAWAYNDPLLFARATWAWRVLPPAAAIVLVVVAATWVASGLGARPRLRTSGRGFQSNQVSRSSNRWPSESRNQQRVPTTV